MSFEPFPKIARLSRECVITEKIDGTNAQIEIVPIDSVEARKACSVAFNDTHVMFAGSRNRYISPADDNYGFAKWVQANAGALWSLGPGRHFGEWWGLGIQRGYGLTEKRFSLFNVHRWGAMYEAFRAGHVVEGWPSCCHVVPVLYRGEFSTEAVGTQIERLRTLGSVASHGFMQPEGLIVFHTAASLMFKKTLEGDEQPKGRAA